MEKKKARTCRKPFSKKKANDNDGWRLGTCMKSRLQGAQSGGAKPNPIRGLNSRPSQEPNPNPKATAWL